MCNFDAERRLAQILFTSPQSADRGEALAAEARVTERYGPPGEILSHEYPEGNRADRVMIWRGETIVLTATIAHYLPDGGWVVFENYSRTE